jgi:hypothetical protein
MRKAVGALAHESYDPRCESGAGEGLEEARALAQAVVLCSLPLLALPSHPTFSLCPLLQVLQQRCGADPARPPFQQRAGEAAAQCVRVRGGEGAGTAAGATASPQRSPAHVCLPAILPAGKPDPPVSEGTLLHVIGWGAINDARDTPEVLMEVGCSARVFGRWQGYPRRACHQLRSPHPHSLSCTIHHCHADHFVRAVHPPVQGVFPRRPPLLLGPQQHDLRRQRARRGLHGGAEGREGGEDGTQRSRWPAVCAGLGRPAAQLIASWPCLPARPSHQLPIPPSGRLRWRLWRPALCRGRLWQGRQAHQGHAGGQRAGGAEAARVAPYAACLQPLTDTGCGLPLASLLGHTSCLVPLLRRCAVCHLDLLSDLAACPLRAGGHRQLGPPHRRRLPLQVSLRLH